jgi:hypothetical protein
VESSLTEIIDDRCGFFPCLCMCVPFYKYDYVSWCQKGGSCMFHGEDGSSIVGVFTFSTNREVKGKCKRQSQRQK